MTDFIVFIYYRTSVGARLDCIINQRLDDTFGMLAERHHFGGVPTWRDSQFWLDLEKYERLPYRWLDFARARHIPITKLFDEVRAVVPKYRHRFINRWELNLCERALTGEF